MTRKTLVEQIDGIQYSEAACELFGLLAEYTTTDEMGMIVLVTAALLLAGECPGETAASAAALNRLIEEFGDLAFRMHHEIEDRRGLKAGFRIVGGTDIAGGTA